MNDTVLTGSILIPLLVSVAFISIYVYKKREQETFRAYQPQALKRNGMVRKDKNGYIKLFIRQDNTEIAVGRIPRQHGIGGTLFQCRLPGKLKGAIQIATRGKGILPESKDREISSGDDFERVFIVKSEDGNAVRQLLSVEVRSELMKLNSFAVWLRVRDDEFDFFALKWLFSQEELDVFIDAALQTLRQMKTLLG